jgi:CheY-like chemotaxis protein
VKRPVLLERNFSMATSILVVDDSAVSRSIVIRSLPKGWDVAISQASNGREALIVLEQKPHAVVLLDLNMPVMDGYEFLEAMKQSSLPRPVVIVLSGDIQPGAQARVRELGACAFVKKPVRADTVLGALKASGVL